MLNVMDVQYCKTHHRRLSVFLIFVALALTPLRFLLSLTIFKRLSPFQS